MLSRRDIEEIVRSQLDPGSGFVISASVDVDHCLTLTVRASPTNPAPVHVERAEARIKTNGVDTFVLDLDQSLEYRDIDWQPEGQGQILTLMTRLAQAYLRGDGRESEQRGLTGRRYGRLTLELDGEPYVFRGKRL